MLCEAGKGICPHCVKADVLPGSEGKGAQVQLFPPALGNWLYNKGKVCRVTGCGVAIGSGKSTGRGSVFWQIALNHQDCLRNPFLCSQETVLFVFNSTWKDSSSDNEHRPMNPLWVSGWFVSSKLLKVFSCFTQLLLADLPSAD